MEGWDVEVQLGVSCRRIFLAGLCPADTTVGDLKRMVFEREGCQPETCSLLSPQLGRLDDHRTLAHYADRLLPPAVGASPAARRPSVRLQLRWRSIPRLFSLPLLPSDQASGLGGSVRRRVVKEIQMLLGARPPPNREISTAGLHLWEAHAATMAHFVFLVEAPDEASPYRGGTFAVRMSLPAEYPFQRPHMQVITPIHHPLIAPDGRLALHHFLSGEEHRDWEPRMFIVDLLQMFRQQLLVTDYDHVRETCKLVEPLAEAVHRWTADSAGQARKAAAMTALFAMTDTERAKRWPNWADTFASLHPQYGREMRTLAVLASRNSHALPCSAGAATTTLSDLPIELVAMIADHLLHMHMTNLTRSHAQPSFFSLPPDWRTRVITTPPESN